MLLEGTAEDFIRARHGLIGKEMRVWNGQTAALSWGGAGAYGWVQGRKACQARSSSDADVRGYQREQAARPGGGGVTRQLPGSSKPGLSIVQLGGHLEACCAGTHGGGSRGGDPPEREAGSLLMRGGADWGWGRDGGSCCGRRAQLEQGGLILGL